MPDLHIPPLVEKEKHPSFFLFPQILNLGPVNLYQKRKCDIFEEVNKSPAELDGSNSYYPAELDGSNK